jgi:predicted RNase H-like HicB family nuclease
MLVYKAIFKYVDGGVHAEALDFPGAITFGHDLAEARRLLASVMVDLAELHIERGEPLPLPDPSLTGQDVDLDADLDEPIYLLIQAASRVAHVPQDAIA